VNGTVESGGWRVRPVIPIRPLSRSNSAAASALNSAEIRAAGSDPGLKAPLSKPVFREPEGSRFHRCPYALRAHASTRDLTAAEECRAKGPGATFKPTTGRSEFWRRNPRGRERPGAESPFIKAGFS